MADKKPAPTLTPLVAQRVTLLAEIEAAEQRLAEVDKQLIALGAGSYADAEGHKFLVVPATPVGVGAPSYALAKEHESRARELAGEAFGDLFDRVVSFSPKPGFVDRADAVLTPAKARDLVRLCFVPGKPTGGKGAYVRKG